MLKKIKENRDYFVKSNEFSIILISAYFIFFIS